MNTNANTPDTDANNEAAQVLSNMFAGITIAKTSASNGTITLTLADGDTITIRHETRTATSSAKPGPRKPEPAAASRSEHETQSKTARRSPPRGLKRPKRTMNQPITATTQKRLKPFRCTTCLTAT